MHKGRYRLKARQADSLELGLTATTLCELRKLIDLCLDFIICKAERIAGLGPGSYQALSKGELLVLSSVPLFSNSEDSEFYIHHAACISNPDHFILGVFLRAGVCREALRERIGFWCMGEGRRLNVY